MCVCVLQRSKLQLFIKTLSTLGSTRSSVPCRQSPKGIAGPAAGRNMWRPHGTCVAAAESPTLARRHAGNLELIDGNCYSITRAANERPSRTHTHTHTQNDRQLTALIRVVQCSDSHLSRSAMTSVFESQPSHAHTSLQERNAPKMEQNKINSLRKRRRSKRHFNQQTNREWQKKSTTKLPAPGMGKINSIRFQ